jgi:hypothetical protein
MPPACIPVNVMSFPVNPPPVKEGRVIEVLGTSETCRVHELGILMREVEDGEK